MADIGNIVALADNCGIPVIEECAQAHGAVRTDGRPASYGRCVEHTPPRELQ